MSLIFCVLNSFFVVISAQDIFGGVLKGGAELTSNIQVLALVFSARIQMEMGNVEEAMSLYSTALPHIGLDPMVIGDVARMLMDSSISPIFARIQTLSR